MRVRRSQTSLSGPATAALTSLLLATAALLTLSTPASAFFGRPLIAEFGSFAFGTGDTIDQSTGNVYVIDGTPHNEIWVFGPEGGAPVGGGPSKFNGAGNPAKEFKFAGEVENPAFDANKHVLWFPDAHNNNVEQYKLEGGEYKFVCQITSGGTTGNACTASGTSGTRHFDEPLGVAVDTASDLYVSDWGNSDVDEFNPAGEQIAVFPLEYKPQYVAVGPTGTLYVNPYRNGPMFEYTRSSLTGPVEGVPVELPGGSVSGIAINETTGNVIVDHASAVEELNAQHESVGGTPPGALGGAGEGVAVDEATNHVYAVAQNKVREFGAGVLLPDVATGAASEVTRSTASVAGTVNPEKTKTGYFVQYGETEAFGKTTPVEEAGEGEETLAVKVNLDSLKGNTTYYYRLVAENANGRNFGNTATFTTPPAIENINTLATTGVTATGATFHGELTPNGFTAECWFEYEGGKVAATKTANEPTGAAFEVVNQEAPVSGLEPNIGYQDRYVCENTFGRTFGPFVPFQTLIAPPAVISEETTNVTRKRAVLLAAINPENSVTSYHFEYGLTASYGYRTAEQNLSSSAFGEQAAQGVAGELKSNTLYHFRVVARNAAGIVRGGDATFTSGALTPPLVSTGEATDLSPNGATLTGTVSTEGQITSYGFEISTSAVSFGPPTGLVSVGAGFSEAPASLVLHGLQPHTTYYFKLVATNADGTAEGEVRSFTTTSYPSPNITVEQLRVLTEPFVEWLPSARFVNTAHAPARPKPCKKRTVRHKKGQCVKKGAKKKPRRRSARGKR